jgi:hypothetical protein
MLYMRPSALVRPFVIPCDLTHIMQKKSFKMCKIAILWFPCIDPASVQSGGMGDELDISGSARTIRATRKLLAFSTETNYILYVCSNTECNLSQSIAGVRTLVKSSGQSNNSSATGTGVMFIAVRSIVSKITQFVAGVRAGSRR